MRKFSLVVALFAACSSQPSKEDEENQKLVQMHTDIWKMMGLSQAAQDELNRFVLTVNQGIQKNRGGAAIEPKRDPNWQKQTHEQYVQKHKERFTKLGISEATQKELFQAMDFVWSALHDPNVPEKDKELAKKIQDMMKQLPKCCDDSIFERAAPH